MNQQEIALWRLHNQHIAGEGFTQAVDVVRWLGAVQAQDYPAAKWAVGLRTAGLTDAAVEQAVSDGAILRTHVLRPTWHFVMPEDIRWMLRLTAPRIKTAMRSYYREAGLDETILARSRDVFIKALEGGRQLTRKELVAALDAAGVVTGGIQRFNFIIVNAELDGLVCSGAYRGKQPTYVLLDERVPPAPMLERDQALAELALRYFTSHAPASLKDYVWWSGLTTADARAGLDMIKSRLVCEVIDGTEYWLLPSAPPVRDIAPSAYLLPNYDEYIVGYTDRSAVSDPAHDSRPDMRGSDVFNHTIVIDSQVVGIWKRTVKPRSVSFELTRFRPLTGTEEDALAAAVRRYEAFIGLPVEFR